MRWSIKVSHTECPDYAEGGECHNVTVAKKKHAYVNKCKASYCPRKKKEYTTCPYCKKGKLKISDNGFSVCCDNDGCERIWEDTDWRDTR